MAPSSSTSIRASPGRAPWPTSTRRNTDPFFKEFVANYTNAAMIIDDQFRGTEDLDGVFSGLLKYTPGVKEWPLDGFIGQYDTRAWQYAAAPTGSASTP